jgi:hypothetical protein
LNSILFYFFNFQQNRSKDDEATIIKDDEEATLLPVSESQPPPQQSTITSTGLKVLALLAFQNCSKNLIMRYAVQDKPDFLYSAAVIGSELTKLSLSILYILLVSQLFFF